MSFFDAMKISASGLAAQRLRTNVLAANLSNAEATRGEEGGGPYKRRDVVFEAKPVGSSFEDLLQGTQGSQLRTVNVRSVHKDNSPPRMVHDPGHPDANEQGYVAKPNISPVVEMVNLIAAQRAFEANATALNDSKQMAIKALEIGR